MECNWIKEPIYRISSLSPTLFFSLSFPPCTCSTPTPPRFNLSLKGWTNSPSKLFSSMSLSSQITQVATHLPQHSSLNTLFILLLYLLYAFYNPPFHPCKKKKKKGLRSVQCSVLQQSLVICICMIRLCVCKCMALAVRGQACLISILYPFYNGIYKGLFV